MNTSFIFDALHTFLLLDLLLPEGENWKANRCGCEADRRWLKTPNSDQITQVYDASLTPSCFGVVSEKYIHTERVHIKRTSEHQPAKFDQPDTLQRSVW